MTQLGDQLRALAAARMGRSEGEDAFARQIEVIAARVDLVVLEADQVVPSAYSSAMVAVCDERLRQRYGEGWDDAHDDEHAPGEMAIAAAAYAYAGSLDNPVLRPRLLDLHSLVGSDVASVVKRLWPWDWKWWKPKDPRRDLVRAGALIIAEIERLDRAASKTVQTQPEG